LTLIFGENARGKTMLSAILRSLGAGDPQYLLERKSIKSSKEPEACVRVTSASHTQVNGPVARLEHHRELPSRPCASFVLEPEIQRCTSEVRHEN
jgi:hypothetical protein